MTVDGAARRSSDRVRSSGSRPRRDPQGPVVRGDGRLRRPSNPVIDPDKSKDGWIPTDDGAFVVNEPQGSPTWYPVNDTPKDKATFDFAITVPEGHTAIANGLLVGTTDNGDTTTWRWRASDPTAPYLATVTSGIFETDFGALPSGLPQYNAVDPQTRRFGSKEPNPLLAWERLSLNGPAVDLFTELYGPYPFESVGGVVDWAPNVFYSLESQTRPMYWHVPSESTVVHEIAHMWFGDAVGLEMWSDIWLNEGFATWSEWIWEERKGGATAAATFDALYATPEDSDAGADLWFPAPAAIPGPAEMFHTPVYERGAMTLQALREKLGDEPFFAILRAWYAENRNASVTTADFIALAERVSSSSSTGSSTLALHRGQAADLVTHARHGGARARRNPPQRSRACPRVQRRARRARSSRPSALVRRTLAISRTVTGSACPQTGPAFAGPKRPTSRALAGARQHGDAPRPAAGRGVEHDRHPWLVALVEEDPPVPRARGVAQLGDGEVLAAGLRQHPAVVRPELAIRRASPTA